LFDYFRIFLSICISNDAQIPESDSHLVGDEEGGSVDEDDEEAVVAFADAVAHPGAVVVQLLDAAAAVVAVDRTRRPVTLAYNHNQKDKCYMFSSI
jgi:hypothetical protein